jgi:hypothetical protein
VVAGGPHRFGQGFADGKPVLHGEGFSKVNFRFERRSLVYERGFDM